MNARPRAPLATLVLLLCVGAHADNLRGVIDEIAPLPAPAARVEKANAAARTEFDAALAEYDEQIKQRPFEILTRVQRCRFIEEFIGNYEYATFVDELSEQSQQCRAALDGLYAEHPEVVLWQMERSYGEEMLKKGSKLLHDLQRESWTQGQLARLYAMLARGADTSNKGDLALSYALQALELDEESDVRLIAASRLIARGEKPRARDILTSPVDGSQSKDSWTLTKKMDLLAKAGAYREVVAMHARMQAMEYDHTQVAGILRMAGAHDLARRELELASAGGQFTTRDERERFRFELDLGTPQQALNAYEAWRDQGWKADPLAINRFALFVRDPLLPLKARDLGGLLGFVATLLAVSMLAAVPLAVIHYRGLAVRARTNQAYPTEGWRLRHGWAALCCLVIASVLALYASGSVDINPDARNWWSVDATPQQLAQMTVVESLLAIALLLPLGRLSATRQPAWWGTRWSIAKSCLVGASLGFALRIPLLLVWRARPDFVRAVAPDDDVWELLGAVHEQFGLATGLWLLAVAAPVTEELIFRGVLYRAFAAHIRPGWANILQAALFAAMHMNLRAAVFLFIVGLALGTLARRSGGLVAPMAMHAMFNLIAGLIFL